MLAFERGASVFRVHDVAPVRERAHGRCCYVEPAMDGRAGAARASGGDPADPNQSGEHEAADGARNGGNGSAPDRDGSTPDGRQRSRSDGRRGGARTEAVYDRDPGLSLYTHHGVSEAEREVGQRLVLDLRLDVGETDATVTDSIEDTVDYGEVCQLVALIAQQRSHKTLERLCSTIANRLLADYDLEGVWVKATKPEPPIPLSVDEVSVEVWREGEG